MAKFTTAPRMNAFMVYEAPNRSCFSLRNGIQRRATKKKQLRRKVEQVVLREAEQHSLPGWGSRLGSRAINRHSWRLCLGTQTGFPPVQISQSCVPEWSSHELSPMGWLQQQYSFGVSSARTRCSLETH